MEAPPTLQHQAKQLKKALERAGHRVKLKISSEVDYLKIIHPDITIIDPMLVYTHIISHGR